MEASIRRQETTLSWGEVFARQSVQRRVWVGFCTFLVAFGAIGMLFPIGFMVITALKASGDVFLIPIKWLPLLSNRWSAMPG